MVEGNAYYTSSKVIDIVKMIRKHKELENDLKIIIKGEKFKIYTFLILLPLIIGAIGGIFPFYTLLGQNLEMNPDIINFAIFNSPTLGTLFSILFTLMSCLIITSYYFLKLINREKHSYMIFLVITEFIFIFFLSYTLTINSF
jgi:hypothetical protein